MLKLRARGDSGAWRHGNRGVAGIKKLVGSVCTGNEVRAGIVTRRFKWQGR